MAKEVQGQSGAINPRFEKPETGPPKTRGIMNMDSIADLSKENLEIATTHSTSKLMEREMKTPGTLRTYYTKENTGKQKGIITVGFRGNTNAEKNIGAGDMLPSNVREVVITKAKEGKITGYRAPSAENPFPPRVGYYTSPSGGAYIPVFTGDTIEKTKIATKDEMKTIDVAIAKAAKNNPALQGMSLAKLEKQLFTQRIEDLKQEEVMLEELHEELRKAGYEVPAKTGNKQKDFINALTPIAKAAGKKFNLPWEAIVAQGALESGYKINAKTLFGIKGSGNTMSTREFVNGKYITINDSFKDFGGKSLKDQIVNSVAGYCSFILKNGRYSPAVQAYRNGGTPRDYMAGIAKAGYATDPRYAQSLMGVAQRWGMNIDKPSSV